MDVFKSAHCNKLMIINTHKLRKLKPWHYCLFGGLFLGLILLALKGDAYAKLDPFPAAQFSQSPADFLGNQYVLRAQIDSQLQWDPKVGRILAVLPDRSSHRLPIFIPAYQQENVLNGQRYEMLISVQKGGMVYVEDLRKY